MRHMIKQLLAVFLVMAICAGCASDNTVKGEQVTLDACGVSFVIPEVWTLQTEANLIPISTLNPEGEIYGQIAYYYAPEDHMDELNDLSSDIPLDELMAGLFEILVVREEMVDSDAIENELDRFETVTELPAAEGFHFYYLTDWYEPMERFTEEQISVYQDLLKKLPDLEKSIQTYQPDESLAEQQSQSDENETVTNGDISFATSTLDGAYIDSTVFSEYDLTIVEFWASYCYPDINDLDQLELLYQQLQSSYPNVNFLQVVIDTPDENNEQVAKDALTEAGATFQSIMPNATLGNWIVSNLEGLPTTIFVDKNGNVVGDRIEGVQSADVYLSEMEKTLQTLESEN